VSPYRESARPWRRRVLVFRAPDGCNVCMRSPGDTFSEQCTVLTCDGNGRILTRDEKDHAP
jgi:hypothetical protein